MLLSPWLGTCKKQHKGYAVTMNRYCLKNILDPSAILMEATGGHFHEVAISLFGIDPYTYPLPLNEINQINFLSPRSKP